VLYHWRQTGLGSFSEGAPERCAAASRRAVAGHLARCGTRHADVAPNPHLPLWVRVVRGLPEPAPTVSVILRARDRFDLLERSAVGLLESAGYPAVELLIVAPAGGAMADSEALTRLSATPRVRLLDAADSASPAAAINRAAASATGEVLLLLDADLDTAAPGWLEEMVSQALRPDVGAVGAKLLLADGRVQHCGLLLGTGPAGIADSYEALAPREAAGYAGRLQLLREVSAVSDACLAVRRTLFEAVGGLDPDHRAGRFADVDFCLRLRERGYRVLLTPFAELSRLARAPAGESVPRPDDADAEHMKLRWGAALVSDPFYSPNFSLRDGHYQLAAPRRRRPWESPAEAGGSAALTPPGSAPA
jgi:hypothetical protein